MKKAFDSFNKLSLFLTEYMRDAVLYMRYCGLSPSQNFEKKRFYKIIIEAHTIEKGLSLPNPRSLFGREKIRNLLQMLRTYELNEDDLAVQMALGALNAYVLKHRQLNILDPLISEIESFLLNEVMIEKSKFSGGVRHFRSGEVDVATGANDLLFNRFSCRMYSAEPLSREVVKKIVFVAQTCPSQCNRQSTHVYYFDDANSIRALLELQAGSAGFADNVPGLFIITFDLAAWGGAQQRNQGYVDASLFAMNLMLSARAEKAMTCPLNLAVRHSTERKIKKIARISIDQRLVMMIALGSSPEGELRAAASPRRSLDEILHFPEGEKQQ